MNLIEFKNGINKIGRMVERISKESVQKFGEDNFELELRIEGMFGEAFFECQEEVTKEQMVGHLNSLFTRKIRRLNPATGKSRIEERKLTKNELEELNEIAPPIAIEILVRANNCYQPSDGLIWDLSKYKIGKTNGTISPREYDEILNKYNNYHEYNEMCEELNIL